MQLAVGTHALIQEGVQFKAIGLGVIDEQHRFGVLQRAALKRLGGTPRHPADDRDADPADAGDGGLRRPRHLRARRAAAGPHSRCARCCATKASGRRSTTWCKRELDRGRQGYVVYPLVEELRGDGAARCDDDGPRAGARGVSPITASAWCTAR